MAGKGSHSMLFRELTPDQLGTLRGQLNLQEWQERKDNVVQQENPTTS